MIRSIFFVFCFGIFALFSQEMNWKESEDFLNSLEKELLLIEKSTEALSQMQLESNENYYQFTLLVAQKEKNCENFEQILIHHFIKRQLASDDQNLTQKITLVYQMIEKVNRLKSVLNSSLLAELKKDFEDFKKWMKISFQPRHRYLPKENS